MILMNDFKAEPEELQSAMLDAASRVMKSGWYVLGKEGEHFETEWALRCGARYGVGVGNGMDAIEIALRTLGIGPGDEVITTSMTAFATVLAILRAGAVPVLADTESSNPLLSIESVERCVTTKTKALLLVHLYGEVRNMQNWVVFCQDKKIELVEDCAQAHLASWQGKMAGTFGIVGAYSFYPTKNLGALGDGGMLITQSERIAKEANCLRNYGQNTRYYHPMLGMNSRLDELQAAILSVRLRWLAEFTQRRRDIALAYYSGIENPQINLPSKPQENNSHSYHLFVITCDQRDKLQTYLQSHNVQALIHYPVPIHHQQSCKSTSRDGRGLLNSERHANTCLSLPCHPQMTNLDVEKVISVVNGFKF